MQFLSGKKTYLVAVGGIFTAIGGVMTGTMDMASAINLVITSLLGITIRHGVSNVGK